MKFLMMILRLVQNDLRPCPVWRARRVVGPTPDCFLNGLTRQSVIKLAKKRGFEVVERHILEEELPTFSEVLICGSAALLRWRLDQPGLGPRIGLALRQIDEANHAAKAEE